MGHEHPEVVSSAEPTSWWRQPSLQFLVLGTAVFLVDGIVSREERTIIVDESVRAEVVADLRARVGREPESAELEAELERWKRDEALRPVWAG